MEAQFPSPPQQPRSRPISRFPTTESVPSLDAKNDKLGINVKALDDPNDAYMSIGDGDDGEEIDSNYVNKSPWAKWYRSVVFQMILFGALSFVGPAISDAISNLGGGGLSSPYLANLANSLNYASGCVLTLLGGPLINKIGIKYSCVIAALAMPLVGTSYYSSARFNVTWFLLVAQIVGGFTSGFLYVAETTAMLSYPPPNDRGFYLSIWSAMRNLGSIIGGAINFSTNHRNSGAGGIVSYTYLIFVGFECTGLIWAFLLSSSRRVRRADGSRIQISDSGTWISEFTGLWHHLRSKKTWLVFIPAFYSFFYGGTMGTYLSIYFSTRSRALSSFITPCVSIPLLLTYGRLLLDQKHWSQRKRAWLAFLTWLIPQTVCFIWIGLEYYKLGSSKHLLDYLLNRKEWAEAYVPYLVLFTTGYLTQLSLYWILGTFSVDMKISSRTGGLFRAFETAGQAVSYAINSQVGGDVKIGFFLNCAILLLTIPCMIFLIRMVPEGLAGVDVDAKEVREAASHGTDSER